MDENDTQHRYLRVRRNNLLGMLDGLSQYDVRRPLTPTGTNLLGLVKHVASMKLGYFGEVFGRPSGGISHTSTMTPAQTLTPGLAPRKAVLNR